MIDKIRDCRNMEQLDALRMEIVKHSRDKPHEFKAIQKEFVKKKNQLKHNALLRENIVWKGE